MNTISHTHISHFETQKELIDAGYHKISKHKFQKRQNSKEYATKILQTFFITTDNGKLTRVNQKTYQEYQNTHRSTLIKTKYFSKKLKEKRASFTASSSAVLRHTPLTSNASSSSLGAFDKLPIELVNHILSFLTFDERLKMKSVSNPFYHLASNKDLDPEAKLASKGLEVARPYLIKTRNLVETPHPHITMTLFFDSESNFKAYEGDNTGLYEKGDDSDELKKTIEERKFEEIEKRVEKWNFITLHWQPNNQYGLGVYRVLPESDKDQQSSKNGVVDNVFKHTIILANQLWNGANKIAQNEQKMYRGILGTGHPTRPHWELIIEDPQTYPMDQILEAAQDIKHVAKKKSKNRKHQPLIAQKEKK